MSEPVIQIRHEFAIVSPANETIAGCTVEERHGVLWIFNLWTHHEHRRKGYATRILNAAIALYGKEPLYLTVGAYTDRAVGDEQLMAWYSRFGFKPIEKAPGLLRRPPTGAGS